MNNLKERSLAWGAAWALAGRWAERGISLLSISLLARLLTPSQFGVVATAGLIVGAIDIFFSFGFDWALVRLEKPSDTHYSTAWTMKLLLATASAAILSILAVPASLYFKNADLAAIIWVMALGLIVGGLENPALVDFRRKLDFRPEFNLRLAVKLASFFVSSIVAWRYRTYWALPLGVLSSRLVAVSYSYILHPFRPKFTLKERTSLLSYSIWLLLNNMIEYLRSRVADAFVARQLGGGAMGYMALSQELSQVAVGEFAAPINRAVFSKLSANRHDEKLLKRSYLQASGLIWLICLPIALTLLMNAELAVRALYGEQWSAAGILVTVMLIGNVFSVVAANASYVFLATGEGRLLTKLAAIGVVVTLLSLIPLVNSFGLLGAAVAYVIGVVVPLPILMTKAFSKLNLTVRAFLAQKWRSIIGGVAIILASTWLDRDVPQGGIAATARLLFNGAIAGFSYVAVVTLLWRVSNRTAGPEALIADKLREAMKRLKTNFAGRHY